MSGAQLGDRVGDPGAQLRRCRGSARRGSPRTARRRRRRWRPTGVVRLPAAGPACSGASRRCPPRRGWPARSAPSCPPPSTRRPRPRCRTRGRRDAAPAPAPCATRSETAAAQSPSPYADHSRAPGWQRSVHPALVEVSSGISSSRSSVAPPMISTSRSGSTSACTSPRSTASRQPRPHRAEQAGEAAHHPGVELGVGGHVGDQAGQRGAHHRAGEDVAGRLDHRAHVGGDVARRVLNRGRASRGTRPRAPVRPCSTTGGTAPSWWCRPARRPPPSSGSNIRFRQADPRSPRSMAASIRGSRGPSGTRGLVNRRRVCFHNATHRIVIVAGR